MFTAETDDGHRVELVDASVPPAGRDKQWVLVVSTLLGCPMRCAFCDAGGHYEGRLRTPEILAQIDYLIRRTYPDGRVPVPEVQVHFSRMGEPSFNPGVLAVLHALPRLYDAPGLRAHVSTVAPARTGQFFEGLLSLKRSPWRESLRLQFSLHTTSEALRKRLVPVRTWSFDEMARYGVAFVKAGGGTVQLSFALIEGVFIEPDRLAKIFTPRTFSIRLTPLTPTAAAENAGLRGLNPVEDAQAKELVRELRDEGFDVEVNPYDVRDIETGSACGMYRAGDRESLRPRRLPKDGS